MLQLSVSELTTFRWSLEEDIENLVALGIPALGIWRDKLTDCGEEVGIDLICESGLEVSSVMWAGGFTGSDGRSHRDGIADAIDALHLAACLNAGCLIVYTGGRGGHTWKHCRRMATNALRELAFLAGDLGVTLALEPMHPGCAQDWTFLNSLDDTLALLDEVGSPHVKIVLDTYHLGMCPDIVERIPEIAPLVTLVHLGDALQPPCGEQDRCQLGEGIVPLDKILTALHQCGFDGHCEIELLGEAVEQYEYSELIENSVRAVEQMTSLANLG